MYPQISEAWGSGYMQVIVTLLVFALGIPAIIYSLFIPENIKKIVYKREKRFWFNSFIIYIVFSILMFVWILHPCPDKVLNENLNLLTGLILTSVIIIICINFLRRLSKNIGEKTVKKIYFEFEKQYKKTNRKIKTRTIENEALYDLIDLGIYANSGHEKQLIIENLKKISNLILDNKPYKTQSLDDIIYGIEKIVLDKNKPGNDDDVIEAVNFYKFIIDRLKESGENGDFDKELVLARICNIAVKTINYVSDDTTFIILNIIKNYKKSEWIFNVGLVGMQNKKYIIALSVLSSLEELVELAGDKHNQDTYYLVGMISYFWFDGNSGQMRADKSFELLRDIHKVDVEQVLKQAQNFFYVTCEFETADKINELTLAKFKK
ncbi:MAG: hypothetical protein HOO91_05395 [Bacteroidales bacterium]|nr:hypothetical protein [Bacteroidales bacterium]